MGDFQLRWIREGYPLKIWASGFPRASKWCVCIHKQDVVYYCANGHIICEVFKSESAFCRRYLVEESLAVSRSLPFLRTTNPTGSVQKLFLSHVIFASIISSIVFHIVFHIFHILYQLYQHHLSTLSRGSHHLQICHHQFPHPKTRLVPRLTHGMPWPSITKVPCAPVTVPTKAKPKDSGSCGSKVWPSPVLTKWEQQMGEMAMEIWGKHGEKPWKSMGNPWEKLGKSGRSGETQRVQWSRLPWK